MADDGYTELAVKIINFAIADSVDPVRKCRRWSFGYPVEEMRQLYPSANGNLCEVETRNFFHAPICELYAALAGLNVDGRTMYWRIHYNHRVRANVRANLRQLRRL